MHPEPMLNLTASAKKQNTDEASSILSVDDSKITVDQTSMFEVMTGLYAIPEEDDNFTQYSLAELSQCIHDKNEEGVITKNTRQTK